MTSLVTPLEQRRRAVVLLYLRTGSRFETPDHNGLSHFVEHMLFRGTDQHPTAYQLAQAFEELGGTLDASTAADHGTLGISLPPTLFWDYQSLGALAAYVWREHRVTAPSPGNTLG